MFRLTLASRFLALTLCFAFAACAGGRMSSGNRAAIRNVQAVNPKSGAEAKIYQDATNANAARVGSAFGLVGGLIAGGVIAQNTASGLERWAPVLSGRQAGVLALVRQRVEKQFSDTAGLRFPATAPYDAQFVFDPLAFGVAHLGDQEFVAQLSVQVQIKKPSGEVAWRAAAAGTSTMKRSLEQFRSDPASFTAALDEAATALAKALVERL